ncbi:TRAP transporter small permease subunit [Ruegeria profundi]|uniref:C4-dicarboxylate ABC transporter permease n=1 Tax=Ruegeria profundi TaxID=1685378 RepID=A0A0X3U1X9_9RHOB|nr:C4-dicarboxylate ABC transporter permease [Ruegeria profundi]KUJ82085.1 C4-dicarboxylate ABC transporter permease [Ruegeria profundi]MCA0927338.1 C4-dicarboxylate ABC transporter permease [Ruegeria profundi]
MDDSSSVGLTDALAAIGGGIVWVLQNLAQAFYNIGYAVTHPGLWLDWSDKEAVMRFVYYGGSVEFFFAVFAILLVITIIGIIRNPFMWGCVRVLEGFTNTLGRFFAWAGLLMVLQQIIIVIMQRIFTRPDIVIAFGIPVQFDISWYAEMLKFYNALVVSFCVGYTFVQGGHVRVDLLYAPARFGTKKVVDMLGSVFFMMPLAVLVWMYGWYFMWRHLIVPKPSASDTLDRLLMKARAMRWNVETIGFSPNGFTAYFLFKIMLVAFAGLVFLQAVAFLYRSYLEYVEGPESDGKYLDKDSLGEGEEAYEGAH